MNILYIAPVADYESKDGGYGNGSASILFVMNKMLKDKKIDKLTVLNTNKPFSFDSKKDIYDIAIVVSNPQTFKNKQTTDTISALLTNCKKKYLVVLWETMPLPKEWDFLWKEDMFDGFLAPSYFVGVQLSKVTNKDIYYQPYYVHVDENNKIDLNKKIKEDKFTILFMGQNTKRKGVEEAIISFSRAFDQCKDAQLIMKYHNLSSFESPFEETVKELSLLNQCCKNARIYTLDSQLTPSEITELYRSSSLLFFPTRGEGFGLTAVESMSVGLPVAYTNWSSCPEVAESEANTGIDYNLDEAVSMYHYGYEVGLKYALPSITDSIRVLKEYYNMWKKDKINYYTKSSSNIKTIKDRFSYEVVSDCLLHAFNNKDGFASDKIFNIEHWNRNLDQYNKIEKGEL
jgi:glycosyltransferase involved in cell wall biosynthesis